MLTWWFLKDSTQKTPGLTEQFQIEHIYAKERAKRENFSGNEIEFIGNKVLLERKINIRASDFSFADKEKHYKKSQNNELNSIHKNYSKFGKTEIIERNSIDVEDMIDITFTVTPDLTKVFPALAVRKMGITDVPLIDMLAPDIEGALEKCIRTIIRFNTEKKNSQMHPVYLRGAKVLRPDIVAKEEVPCPVFALEDTAQIYACIKQYFQIEKECITRRQKEKRLIGRIVSMKR